MAAEGADPAVPPLTRSLELAEKWAHHRRDATSRGAGIFAEGKVEPVVRIYHGSHPIYVRDLGKCLMVLGVLDIPAEVRARLGELSPAERAEFLENLEEQLMQCPRVGFGLAPPGVSDPSRLERGVFDQTLQIAENDAGSFNRFCDAIQETENLLLKALGFLQRSFPSTPVPLRYSSSTPPPRAPYL